jgi:hypothetical protein
MRFLSVLYIYIYIYIYAANLIHSHLIHASELKLVYKWKLKVSDY